MLSYRMRILTGIKPTGILHIGNYFGSIKQLLDYQNENTHEVFAFIANAHALTVPGLSADYQLFTKSLLAGYLASGIDPEKVCLYKQTDIPETFALAWILTCFCTKGVLDRSHAYKAFKDTQKEEAVGLGLYTYPILMSADILGVNADIVPVGQDQKQHVEICRDLAIKVNHHITAQGGSAVFTVPAVQIQSEQSIIGLDGRKMSKSYNNTIGLFADSASLKKLIYGIKTDSSAPHEQKAPETLLAIYSLFATKHEIAVLTSQYETGIGWAAIKEMVYKKAEEFIAPIRGKYTYYMQRDSELDAILKHNAAKVRPITQNLAHKALAELGL